MAELRTYIYGRAINVDIDLKILYLQDQPYDLKLVEGTLAAEGLACSIVRVSTREDFEAALEQEQFDVIFSDKALPSIDGLSALALAREKHPDVPFIFVSDTPDEEEAIDSLKRGATDYVLKHELNRLVPVTKRALREAEERRERRQALEALRGSELRFRALIENSADAIALFEPDGAILYGSPATARILGYPPEEFVGYNTFDLIHQEDRALVMRCIGESIQQPGVGVEVNVRVLHRDGSWRWIEGVFTNLLAEPNIQAIVNNYRDITERKQVEDELRKEKEILQKIFDHIPMMIGFIGEDGRITLVNQEWERIVGWSIEEKQDANLDIFTELFPDPQYRQKVLNFIDAATGQWAEFKTRLADGKVIETAFVNIRLSDGTTIGIGQNISERKRAEDAEREQRVLAEALRDTAAALSSTLDFEEVLDRILENVGLVVPHETSFIVLLEDDHLRVARHKGLTERGLKEWVEGLRPTLDERPIYRRIVQTAQPLVIPDTQAEPDLARLPELDWIRSFISAPIHVKGEIIGFLNLHSSLPGFFTNSQMAHLQAFADQAAVALENASLLREVRTARERLQTLSNRLLVAQEAERQSVARELHDEVGQVLTAVGANLRALELSSNRMTRVQRLGDSLKLVDEALSRVRDLSFDLRPSLLDDFGLVPALEWYIDRQAQRSGFKAEFLTQLPEMRVPPGLETTCFRVAQIALTNVIRHARAKHARVELRFHKSELELSVQDDGIGFDVQAALERAAQGATLGLLSMQERVRLARGGIEIRSTPGQGTIIRARFPVE
jgi:PAS domain S-box-containing protein